MFADNLAITIQTLITYYPVILVHMEKKVPHLAKLDSFILASWVGLMKYSIFNSQFVVMLCKNPNKTDIY